MEDKQNVISIPSFTREELSFKVVKVEPGKSKVDSKKLSKYDYLGSLLNNYKKHFPDIFEGNGTDSRCGIIFTPHVNGKRGCYPLAADLRHDFKARVEFYSGEEPNHVGNGGKAPLYDWLESELPFDRYKKKVQEDFKDNQYTLLTATKAFGMGIDKPNIRYTVHYGIPSSLEALYQEAGRAGRDRQRAQCTILYTPESQEVQSKIDDLLSVDSSIDQIHDFINQMGWDGEDSVTQLRLMDNGMVSFDEEKESIKELIEQYAFPGKRDTLIKYGYNTGYTLQGVQRDIYHLSLIGVVYDWTVDFKGKTISVDFRDYTRESIIESTQNYIRNYESTYDITTDPIYIEETAKEEAEEASIITALTVFWNWYYNNITYSRKQALYNVYEACNAYTDATADEFKEKMEAYFRLDDITDMFGIIADALMKAQGKYFLKCLYDRVAPEDNKRKLFNLDKSYLRITEDPTAPIEEVFNTVNGPSNASGGAYHNLYYNRPPQVQGQTQTQQVPQQTQERTSVPILTDSLNSDGKISTPPSELSFSGNVIGITGAGLF